MLEASSSQSSFAATAEPFASRSFLVPRGGELVPVTVSAPDEVRSLRTELELLRQIAYRIRHIRDATTIAREIDDALTHENAARIRFSDEEIADLRTIIEDAEKPEVEQTIGEVDQLFSVIREELVMSIINQEADAITKDAVASGAIAPAGQPAPSTSASPAATSSDLAASVEEALAAAQQGLASISNQVSELDKLEQEMASQLTTTTSANSSAAVTTNSAGSAELESAVVAGSSLTIPSTSTSESTSALVDASPSDTLGQAVQELADVLGDIEATVVEVGSPSTQTSAETAFVTQTVAQSDNAFDEFSSNANTAFVDATTSSTVGMTSAGVFSSRSDSLSRSSSGGSSDIHSSSRQSHTDSFGVFGGKRAKSFDVSEAGSSFADSTAFSQRFSRERAEQTIETINSGIRQLADTLRNEVRGQWNEAQQAFVEMTQMRAQLKQLFQQARSSLEQMRHMGDEATAIRDAADLAKREAQLLREDAKRAKDRAEAAAQSAELAANQASMEMRSVKAKSFSSGGC